MKTKKSFRLILEGPPGSGKSTFLEELLHQRQVKPSWRERYNFTISDIYYKHELLIEAFQNQKKKGGEEE